VEHKTKIGLSLRWVVFARF